MKMKIRNTVVTFIAVLMGVGILGVLAGTVDAQEAYPTRPVQIIVPFAPGGVADLTTRPFATILEKFLKQPVVVVNKAGAGGAVGVQSAAVSKPDGYTLLSTLNNISVAPEVDDLFGRPKTYKYDQLAPISMLSADGMVVIVRKDSPFKSIDDFVAEARRRPGQIKYSSSGIYGPTHVPMEMFSKIAKIKLRHIPTSGGGPSLTALLGGHVDILFSVPIIARGQINSGDVRPLAVTSGKRVPIFPNVLTLKELGYDLDYSVWCGVFAPSATPKGHIVILREAIRKAVAAPEFQAAMEKMYATIEYMDAPEFQKFWEKDIQQMVDALRFIGKVE